MAKPSNLVPLPGSERHPRPGARETGKPDPNERITVSVMLRPRNSLAGLASSSALSATLPGQRQYLSREDFAARYGAHPADIAKIEAFAHQHKLTVVEASIPRRTVVLSGTIAALSAAFGVTLANYSHSTGDFRGRTGAIMIPADLAGVVQAVFGFDNRRMARPHFRGFRAKAKSHASQAASQSGYTPPQIAGLYNFPSGTDGTGQTIGILEFGGGYTASDLDAYFQQIGVATPSVTAVSVDGVSNQPAPGSNSPDVEVDLDIEMSGGVAPGAAIVVYYAPFTEQGWVDAVTTAANDSVNKPSVISVSWGYAEGNLIWSTSAIQAVNDALQAAAAMGITVCVASGDDGSRDEITDGLAHVDFPASSAWVLACGGTTLESSGDTITSEVVWNDGPSEGASGGGVSAVIPLPSWQANANVPSSVNPGAIVGRGVPDVAGNADPETGYRVTSDGQSGIVGGTSAVAPMWAGLAARLNQQLGTPIGFLNPMLYSDAVKSDPLNDITSGNNDITGQIGGYSAGPGWDACTGWGSPNGNSLAAVLGSGGTQPSSPGGSPPAAPPSPSPDPTSPGSPSGGKKKHHHHKESGTEHTESGSKKKR